MDIDKVIKSMLITYTMEKDKDEYDNKLITLCEQFLTDEYKDKLKTLQKIYQEIDNSKKAVGLKN